MAGALGDGARDVDCPSVSRCLERPHRATRLGRALPNDGLRKRGRVSRDPRLEGRGTDQSIVAGPAYKPGDKR